MHRSTSLISPNRLTDGWKRTRTRWRRSWWRRSWRRRRRSGGEFAGVEALRSGTGSERSPALSLMTAGARVRVSARARRALSFHTGEWVRGRGNEKRERYRPRQCGQGGRREWAFLHPPSLPSSSLPSPSHFASQVPTSTSLFDAELPNGEEDIIGDANRKWSVVTQTSTTTSRWSVGQRRAYALEDGRTFRILQPSGLRPRNFTP